MEFSADQARLDVLLQPGLPPPPIGVAEPPQQLQGEVSRSGGAAGSGGNSGGPAAQAGGGWAATSGGEVAPLQPTASRICAKCPKPLRTDRCLVCAQCCTAPKCVVQSHKSKQKELKENMPPMATIGAGQQQ